MSRPLMLFLLSLICAVHLPAQAGFSCSLVGKPGTFVEFNGSRRPVPLGLDECEGAKVVAGSATACFIEGAGRRVCRPFARGSAVTRAGLVETRGLGDGLVTLLAMLMGDGTTVGAVSRGGAVAGLPQGPVLEATPVLRFRLSDTGLKGIKVIEFHADAVDGALVAKLEDPLPTARLQVTGLRPQKTYYWVLAGEAPMPAPVPFTVASKEESQVARRALGEIDADKTAGDLGRAVLKADWLQRHGYVFDAEQLLRDAGLAAGH